MKSFRSFAALCAVVLSAAATQTANAAWTNYRITFTASGFRPGLGTNTNAPVDPVQGMFWIAFDPTVIQSNGPPGTTISLSWLNVKTVNPFAFNYYPSQAGGQLFVCSAPPSPSACYNTQFILVIDNFLSGAPSVLWAGYTNSGPGYWQSSLAGTGSVVCQKYVRVSRRRYHFYPCP
jgi:hypothetical protein